MLQTPLEGTALQPLIVRLPAAVGPLACPLTTSEDVATVGLFFLTDTAKDVTDEKLLFDAGMHLNFTPTRQRLDSGPMGAESRAGSASAG